jgi:uncharacterized membrane protein
MDSNDQDPSGRARTFEEYALTRPEYFNVMTHFYRGESHRAMVWRQRLDTTTNWAVLTTAGVLSFSFSSTEHEPVIILLSNLIILFYLLIEARRYRYFEVYRARVRMLEENFLLPIITRHLDSPMRPWRAMVATDLHKPKFKTTFFEAVAFRLRRNYLFIFSLFFGAWWLKLTMHPVHSSSWTEIYQRMAVGSIPSWIVLSVQICFFLSLIIIVGFASTIQGRGTQDEIYGLEPKRRRWRF